MALVVEEDEALDPVDIAFPGARRVVFAADGLARRIEQLLLSGPGGSSLERRIGRPGTNPY